MLFEPDEVAPDHGVVAEHVGENMIAGGDEFAAMVMPLEDGDFFRCCLQSRQQGRQ